MKYTKKYPIHPKPDKQFSGASIFAYGGKVPPGDEEAEIVARYNKTVPGLKEQQEKDKKWASKYFKTPPTELQLALEKIEGDEYDAAEYLKKSQEGRNSEPTKENPQGLATGQSKAMVGLDDPILNTLLVAPLVGQLGKIAINNAYRLNPWAFKPNPEAYYRGIGKEGIDDVLNSGIIRSKKQNAYPEPYFSKGKIGDAYAKGYFAELTNEPMKGVGSFRTGDLIQTPVSKVSINNPNLKLYKKDWLQGYKELPNFMKKTSGQTLANGGFKYPNGGSFYDSSNINTSKPQVNTIPSSYTDTFTGNNSSVPKTTKDGINFSKDGKALTGSFNTNSSGSFSGNYLGMATAAVGGIGTTVNNANAATNERDKNRAIERGTVDTTMNIVDTAFPIVGAVEGVAGGIGAVIDSTNPSTSYTDPNTGKTYTYKKGDSGTSAAGFKAAVDPRGNATNFIGDITGTTENYGQSNFGMAVADLFVPFLSEAFRNKQREKAANQAQLNNSLMAAKEVDSTARNFSAFGGYKNKFPYGGNMKSEVTGQSYLKDQISDFAGNNFKTHADGGANIDSSNQVEKDEIIYNDYVYSARLKNKDGIPFSTIARRLKNQIKEQHG